MALDRVGAAMEAFKMGKDVGVAVGDAPVEGSDSVVEIDDEPSVLDNLDVDDEAEETPPTEETTEEVEEVQDTKPAKPVKTKEAPKSVDVEEIEADGRKIKVDYKDKAAIKKAYLEAVGMRKFQRERDDARKELSAAKPELEELRSLWSKLEKAFEDEGAAGVVKAVTKGEVDLDKMIEERAERLLRKRNASPAELKAMEDEDRWTAEVKKREKIEKELQAIRDRDAELKKNAEIKGLENAVHPAFNQHRFAGKLGDTDVEHRLDKALWANVKAMIEELPEDQPITNAVVAKMFQEEASVLGRVLKKQAEAGADKIVKDRKRSAKEAAQAQVVAGEHVGSAKKEFSKKFKSGDMTGALTDILSGKVKF